MPLSPDAYNEFDQQIWDEELADFLPARVFDAHIHMFDRAHLRPEVDGAKSWSQADMLVLRDWAKRLFPERQVDFLILGTPIVGIDVDAHNGWIAEQLEGEPRSRANRLTTPACTPEKIVDDVERHGFIGLKPYRLYSVTGDVNKCRIHEFLTHEQLEIANQLGLWVTMHLSQPHGCADEDNLADLAEYTQKRYPNVRWILAHCARSFTYWPIRQAIERLRDLPNIYYDLSAVTDIRPIITLLQQEDRRRIFYGTDGVDATFFRGQYVALGRAWQYLDTTKVPFEFPHCDSRPILAVYEQLLAIKQAAEIVGLTGDDVENIFWRNAVAAFEIESAQASA